MHSVDEQHSQIYTNGVYPSHSNQFSSISSSLSTDNEVSQSVSLSDPSHIVNYGPIRIRLRRSTAPTLATGRRSKYESMFGADALKREERREKNRVAARKLKEKRESIESELLQLLDQLENDRHHLNKTVDHLHERKQQLESEIQQVSSIDPLVRLLSTDKQNMPLFFDDHPDDFDVLDLALLSARQQSDCNEMDELHMLLDV